MEYVRLGNSNLKVSRIGCGAMGMGDPAWRSWVLDEVASRPILHKALDLGINFFDSCNHYSNGASEIVLGRLLKESVPRTEVVIATKMGFSGKNGPNLRGYSRKNIIEAAEQSLKRLGVDYIDLYQTHIWDPATDIEEMIAGFDALVRAGKVLYVGAADMPAWQLAKAVYLARSSGLASFISLQYHYNAIWREAERELMPFAQGEGIGLLPYSPMARGFLSGKARRSGPEQTERARTDNYTNAWYGRAEDETVTDAVIDLARKYDTNPSSIALAWVLAKPVHAPIIGPTQVDHVEDAVKALALKLDPADVAALDSLYAPRPQTSHNS